MSHPYSISYPDDPKYKRFICGRKDDVSRILDLLNHQSIAFFGERRIGKSMLLWLVRDIINGHIDSYRNDLIDIDLKDAIDTLKAKVPSQWKVVYINLLPLEEKTIEALTGIIQKELTGVGLLQSSPVQPMLIPQVTRVPTIPHNASLIDIFQVLCQSTGNNQFIIIFDEIEKLMDYAENTQVIDNLISIMQSYAHVRMMFAGAEKWYYQIKDKMVSLAYTLYPYYVKIPARSSIESYLVKEQLSLYLPPMYDGNEMFRIILLWTGSKAFYVQIVCTVIAEKYNQASTIPDNWQQVAKQEIFSDWHASLDDFYTGNNLDDLTKSILALIATKPGLTVKSVARKLNNSEKVIGIKMDDLVHLNKMEKQAAKYRIVGTLIEEHGKKRQDIPVLQSPWPQLSKWVILCIGLVACIVAFFLIFSSQPDLLITTFNIPNGKIVISLPESLEQGETGQIKITMNNSGPQKLPATHVVLESSDISYQGDDGTDKLDFPELTSYEKTSALNYTVDAAGITPWSTRQLTSQITITEDNPKFSVKYTFVRNQRFFWRKVWIIISGIIGASALIIPFITSIYNWLKRKELKASPN